MVYSIYTVFSESYSVSIQPVTGGWVQWCQDKNWLAAFFYFIDRLEGMARYVGQVLVSVEGIGQAFFCLLVHKRAYYAVLSHLRPLCVLNSNLQNIQ